jgi:methylenetetrahydrofolate dehydrogenase (NADP+)/methenyltetrahydrofolate cyclohydrolase
MATLIDGKRVSEEIKQEVKEEVERFKSETGVTPGLAVVLVGEDPASKVYVRNKSRACEFVGIKEETINLPDTTSEEELLTLVDKLNQDPQWHGFLVQLPLPSQIDEDKVIERIDVTKDVDGFHPTSIGKLVQGLSGFRPATPSGIIELLKRYNLSTQGRHVVIVGRSNIVGKPLANMLVQKTEEGNATVTVCHSRTKDLPSITRSADILVAAIGQPNFIKADMVKEGVIAIDVGINRVDDPEAKRGYRLVGDMDFDEVEKKASHITPVPGGVGAMTVAMLMKNTLMAAMQQVDGNK